MISKSVEETGKIAQDIVKKLKPQTGATVFALSGNLGSGKTTFTKAFVETFGISPDDITSPTFVIMKNYDISFSGFKKFTHIDAYRLENADEILRLGWEALVSDPTNIILVEWPERIGAVLPKNTRTITFSVVDENTREIGL